MECLVQNYNLSNDNLPGDVVEFGKIYVTNDYDSFKLIASNRNINLVNYNKLLRSMKQEQLIIPICVNERMEVIDGQHRLKVCKTLGLNVYFYVLKGYSISQMKRANLVSRNWNKDDFLNAYVNEHNQHYIAFYELKNRYGILTNDLIKIISKFKGTTFPELAQEFEEGILLINEEEKEKVELFLETLEQFDYFKDYRKSKFIAAFIELYMHPAYKNPIMVSKLKTRGKVLEYQLTKHDYIFVLANKIYSFGSSKECIYYNKDTKNFH